MNTRKCQTIALTLAALLSAACAQVEVDDSGEAIAARATCDVPDGADVYPLAGGIAECAETADWVGCYALEDCSVLSEVHYDQWEATEHACSWLTTGAQSICQGGCTAEWMVCSGLTTVVGWIVGQGRFPGCDSAYTACSNHCYNSNCGNPLVARFGSF